MSLRDRLLWGLRDRLDAALDEHLPQRPEPPSGKYQLTLREPGKASGVELEAANVALHVYPRIEPVCLDGRTWLGRHHGRLLLIVAWDGEYPNEFTLTQRLRELLDPHHARTP